MFAFRPHHFFCALGFQGKGYSAEFVENFQSIVDQLRAKGGDHLLVEVVGGSDSICSPCPNRAGEKCTTEAKIRSLDDAHAAVLGVRPGMTLSWGEAKALLAEKMSVEAHHRACAPCSWRSMGVCEAALVELQEMKKEKTRKST